MGPNRGLMRLERECKCDSALGMTWENSKSGLLIA